MTSTLRRATAAALLATFAATAGPGSTAVIASTTNPAARPFLAAIALSFPLTMPPTTDDHWRADVAAICDSYSGGMAAIPDPDGTQAGTEGPIQALRELRDNSPIDLASLDPPGDRVDDLAGIAAVLAESDETLAAAEAAVAAGDLATASAEFDAYYDEMGQVAARFAVSGADCAGFSAERAAGAALNVPLEQRASQLSVAFGSVWVSEGAGGQVVRVDPATGEVLATVDVGDEPRKLQAADGRLWVRTGAAYEAIDPETNAIVATLAKADVGPNANRSWAVDGAMWICDGTRLHRYDPTTIDLVATIDLAVECSSIYATDEVVVAWNYNEDPGESGASAVAIVNPNTNDVVATIELPVDVGGPAVLNDALLFPGYGGSTAVVVDRSTWTVSATPDLDVATGGSGQAVTDGDSIFVGTADHRDVLRVDAETFAVTDVIETLGVNAVDVADGSVWVIHSVGDMLQRFDL